METREIKAIKAVEIIANGNSEMSTRAKEALYSAETILDFCINALEMFDNGYGSQMAITYGFGTTDDIISYARWYINYQENYQVQFIQGFDFNLN